MRDGTLHPIRSRESLITRDPELRTSAPVSAYSMTVNNMVKKHITLYIKLKPRGVSVKSDLRYPERQDGGVRFILYRKLRGDRKKKREKKRRSFKWNKGCGRPQELLRVNWVDCKLLSQRFYESHWFDLSAWYCFSVCM